MPKRKKRKGGGGSEWRLNINKMESGESGDASTIVYARVWVNYNVMPP